MMLKNFRVLYLMLTLMMLKSFRVLYLKRTLIKLISKLKKLLVRLTKKTLRQQSKKFRYKPMSNLFLKQFNSHQRTMNKLILIPTQHLNSKTN